MNAYRACVCLLCLHARDARAGLLETVREVKVKIGRSARDARGQTSVYSSSDLIATISIASIYA